MNGERIVTDITANDGSWHSICVMWHSLNGEWSIYIDGKLGDNGTGLANGTFIAGEEGILIISRRDNNFYFVLCRSYDDEILLGSFTNHVYISHGFLTRYHSICED